MRWGRFVRVGFALRLADLVLCKCGSCVVGLYIIKYKKDGKDKKGVFFAVRSKETVRVRRRVPKN